MNTTEEKSKGREHSITLPGTIQLVIIFMIITLLLMSFIGCGSSGDTSSSNSTASSSQIKPHSNG